MSPDEQKVFSIHQRGTRRADRRSCLSAEELSRLGASEVGEQERQRMADHLGACADCSEEYRVLLALKSWTERVAETEGPHQGADPWMPAAPARTPWRQPFARASSPRAVLAMAAVLLMLSIGLGVWVVSLRTQNRTAMARLAEERAENDRTASVLEETQRRLNEASPRSDETGESNGADGNDGSSRVADLRNGAVEFARPQLNLPIVDLDPRGSLRGDADTGVTTIELPATANLFAVVLNVAGQHSYSDYGLEIADERGKRIWQERGLKKSPYNTFTLALPRRLVPAGRYEIKLFGMSGARRENVQVYAVRLRYK